MEAPERYLQQARDNKAADLLQDMLAGENAEWLWNEIERMLLSKDKADIDGLEDMSIKDIATRVCEEHADVLMDRGDLDEEAMDRAVGDVEDRFQRDMDR